MEVFFKISSSYWITVCLVRLFCFTVTYSYKVLWNMCEFRVHMFQIFWDNPAKRKTGQRKQEKKPVISWNVSYGGVLEKVLIFWTLSIFTTEPQCYNHSTICRGSAVKQVGDVGHHVVLRMVPVWKLKRHLCNVFAMDLPRVKYS